MKYNELSLILKQSQKTTDNKYDIQGIDLSKNTVLVYYRLPNQTFKELAPSHYTISSNGHTLTVDTPSVVAEMEALQIAENLVFGAGEYTDAVVDPETLRTNYNKLVVSSRELWELLKKQSMFSDTQDFAKILPELKDKQTWAYDATTKSFYAIDVVDLQASIAAAIADINAYLNGTGKTTIEAYGKQAVTDELNTQMPDITNAIATAGTAATDQISVTGNAFVTDITAAGSTAKSELDTYVTGSLKPDLDTYTTNTDGKGTKAIDTAVASGNSDLASTLSTALNTLKSEADKLSANQGVATTDFDFHSLVDPDGRYYTPVLGTYLNAPTWKAGETISNTIKESIKDTSDNLISRTVTVKTGTSTYATTYTKASGVWSSWISDLEASGLIIPVTDDSIYTTPMSVTLVDASISSDGLPFMLTPVDEAADGILIVGEGGSNTVGLYYEGEVKYLGTGVDDEGNPLVDEEYYFKSNTIVGGVQRVNPTHAGQIHQTLFRVGHVSTGATDETVLLVEIGDAKKNSTYIYTSTAGGVDALVVKSELDALETKVDALNVAGLDARVTANTGNVSTNTTSIATNNNEIGTNKTSIGTITNDVNALDVRVSTNATNIATNTANITTVTGTASTNTTAITTKADSTAVGNLSDLHTTDKSSIVHALNEVATGSSTAATTYVKKSGDSMQGNLDFNGTHLRFTTNNLPVTFSSSSTGILTVKNASNLGFVMDIHGLITADNQGTLYGTKHKPTIGELGGATAGAVGTVASLKTSSKNCVGAINEVHDLAVSHSSTISANTHAAATAQSTANSAHTTAAAAQSTANSKMTQATADGRYLHLTGGTVHGNIVATGNVTAYSDKRLKTNISKIDVKDKIKQLRLVEYLRTDNKKYEIGVIAQEVQSIFPSCVVTDENGMLSVDYARLGVIISLGGM